VSLVVFGHRLITRADGKYKKRKWTQPREAGRLRPGELDEGLMGTGTDGTWREREVAVKGVMGHG